MILVNRFIYKYKDPKRGDIITFHPPHNHDVTYLKRVIAVPGETIEIKEGFVWINGEKIQESYVSGETLGQTKPLKMGSTEYFVLGDRRNYSLDSREFGPVQKNEIIGKAFFVLYPTKYAKIL